MDDDLEGQAMIVGTMAVVIRNELEDLHADLSVMNNDVMRQINTAVRDGIWTVLMMLKRAESDDGGPALAHLESIAAQIPDYWEAPALLPWAEAEGLEPPTA